jgi:hypothetical protein
MPIDPVVKGMLSVPGKHKNMFTEKMCHLFG